MIVKWFYFNIKSVCIIIALADTSGVSVYIIALAYASGTLKSIEFFSIKTTHVLIKKLIIIPTIKISKKIQAATMKMNIDH